MFGPPIFVVYGLYLFSKWFVVGVYIWKKKAKEANEVKMCKRYERCETARTKRTFKTKRYKQIQIYISTIHAIKHFKTLVL